MGRRYPTAMSTERTFATQVDSAAEDTGIYFDKDPPILFVNVQHTVTQNDWNMVPTNHQAKDLEDVRSRKKSGDEILSANIYNNYSPFPTFRSIHN